MGCQQCSIDCTDSARSQLRINLWNVSTRDSSISARVQGNLDEVYIRVYIHSFVQKYVSLSTIHGCNSFGWKSIQEFRFYERAYVTLSDQMSIQKTPGKCDLKFDTMNQAPGMTKRMRKWEYFAPISSELWPSQVMLTTDDTLLNGFKFILSHMHKKHAEVC